MIPESAGQELRESSPWSTHRLRSPWDMTVNFFFPSVDTVLTETGIQFSVSRKNMEYVAAAGPEVLSDPEAQEAMRQSVESIDRVLNLCDQLFSQLQCPHIDYAIRQLKQWSKNPSRNWHDLNLRSQALRTAIRTEFKEYLFYQYPKEKGRKLLAWKEEWKLALVSFPEIGRDVFCATDCYALGHDVASIFHSMRVAEFGLRVLATERNIKLAKNKPLEWGTWQEIINWTAPLL
jgi:hypothetical protein